MRLSASRQSELEAACDAQNSLPSVKSAAAC